MKKTKTKPRKAISWDECFMRMAYIIAERSKDPSWQAGAVIADERNVVVGLGYNGFPRGVSNSSFPWDREGDFENTKYAYICHAEENAVYNANKSTQNCKVYTNLFPCNECAKTLIQNGIKEVIYESDKYSNTSIVRVSKRLFQAAGVKTRKYVSAYSKK